MNTLRGMLPAALLEDLGAAFAPLTAVRRLAIGGTAEVWRCATPDGAPVVVKAALDLRRHAPLLAREAQALRAVQHPRLVRCLAAIPGALVLPFLPGAPLTAVMERAQRRGRGLPPEAVAGLLAEVGAGLHALHAAGFAHGDLNPNNVIIGPEGAPTLIDLGLAVPLSEQAPTVLGAAGTLAFMAPEQLDGRPVGAATDVYALGLIAYALLAGADWLPRHDLSIGGLLAARRQAPPAISGVSAPLNAALNAALQPDPMARPSLERALAAFAAALPPPDLASLAEHAVVDATPAIAERTVQPVIAPTPAPKPLPAPDVLVDPPQRRLPIALLLGALGAAGLGGVLWMQRPASLDEVPHSAASVAPASFEPASAAPPSSAPASAAPPSSTISAAVRSEAPPSAPVSVMSAPPSRPASRAPNSRPRPPKTRPKAAPKPVDRAVQVRGLSGQMMIAANGQERFAPWTARLSPERPRIVARLHGPAVSATLYLQWVDGAVHMRIKPMPFSTTGCPTGRVTLGAQGRRCTVRLGDDALTFEVRPQ